MATRGTEEFIGRLQQFHDSLPEDEKPMLEAILEAAREGSETGGYMMNPYSAEMVARGQMDDRLREAEHGRMLQTASQGGGERAGAASLFEWLSGWLPAFGTPQQAPREAGGTVGGTS